MILNGKAINPGELRTAVSVQQRTVTADAGGHQVETWTTLATVWARWRNVHGSEAWVANAAQAEQPATVLMRYLAGVEPTCALLKGSERYAIVSIDDIQDRHEYLELKVTRMRPG